jgi:PAS domain S-box-containing protein
LATTVKQMSSSALSFESILDCVSDIVLVTDADLLEDAGPHIVYVNDAFERITGYPRADVIGLNPRFLQ